jgi:HEAT repeat protein
VPPDRQLDLFAASGAPPPPAPTAEPAPSSVTPQDLADADLVAAIADAKVATCHALAEEAGRRRLIAAVPALEALCRRFKGFGLTSAVPEQAAALRGLAAVGGSEAAAAIVRTIVEGVVQEPGLAAAVAAAADLRCRLPLDKALVLLRHPDPIVRANAATCAPPRQEAIGLLTDLLDDLNRPVSMAAACALGRMGQKEARPMLLRLLHEAPSPDVVEAVVPVADDACIVILGRIAQNLPELTAAAIAALDDIETERAATVRSYLRQSGVS